MNAPDWIRLRSDAWSAEINPLGAELSVLRDCAGTDVLWNGDATAWSGRAPILFPVVGALRNESYAWKQKLYSLPRHGFARRRRFELIHAGEQEVLLRLCADDATRQQYPFDFELDVRFRLSDAALITEATVRNGGVEPVPASLGFHPAFRWPLHGAMRDAHILRFDCAEPEPVRRLNASGLLAPVRHASPVIGRELSLDDSLFRDDVVIFDALRSEALTYGAAGFPRLRIGFAGATHLGLWSKPGAGFVCIEPWLGVADPENFTGSLDTKPGTFLLPPGGTRTLAMQVSYAAPDRLAGDAC